MSAMASKLRIRSGVQVVSQLTQLLLVHAGAAGGHAFDTGMQRQGGRKYITLSATRFRRLTESEARWKTGLYQRLSPPPAPPLIWRQKKPLKPPSCFSVNCNEGGRSART